MDVITISYAIFGVVCFVVLVWASRPLSTWGLFHWVALLVLSIFWPVVATFMVYAFYKKGKELKDADFR